MNILPNNSLLDLSGKTAIVTGGSVGIGYGICFRLAAAGANVVIAGRNLDDAKKAADELTQKGYQVIAVKADVSVESDVTNLLEETIKVNACGTHGGGDRAIMDNFIDAIETGDKSILFTPIKDSLEGHLMVFAAEESRKTGTVVDMRKYEAAIRSAKR